MKGKFLFGEFDLAIDEKSRLLVPADVRRRLDPVVDGEAFYVTVGGNGKTWLYPELRYEALVQILESELTPDQDRMDFDQMNFSMVSRVEVDKQGRVLVSEQSRSWTGLGREITMIGANDHLELWNREEWLPRRKELQARRNEIYSKQRKPTSRLPA